MKPKHLLYILYFIYVIEHKRMSREAQRECLNVHSLGRIDPFGNRIGLSLSQRTLIGVVKEQKNLQRNKAKANVFIELVKKKMCFVFSF